MYALLVGQLQIFLLVTVNTHQAIASADSCPTALHRSPKPLPFACTMDVSSVVARILLQGPCFDGTVPPDVLHHGFPANQI